MACDFNVKCLFNCLFDVLNARITKLLHFATVNQNDMIVLLVEEGFLVVCLTLAKVVLTNQPAQK